jgi:ATP/maltotriose-dependent transcriptional regulator MalT
MIFDFKSENIKLVVIDDETNNVISSTSNNQSENCYCEIRIKKSLLNKILLDIGFVPIESSSPDIVMTNREIQVLKYLAGGLNNQEISKLMNVSVHTIKAHIHNIFEKLSVQGRTEAVVKAIKDNLINL